MGVERNTRNAAGGNFSLIRFFGLMQKISLLGIKASDLYQTYIKGFNPTIFSCPICRTKHPSWKRHATYERYIISFEKGESVTYQVLIIRYICSCCEHTHAMLPEFLVPYRSYSILFILSVLKDYFSKNLTIEKICVKYGISVSTIYSWKALFLKHKKIWLGLLEDYCITSIEFIKSCFDKHIYALQEFYLEANLSFLQSTRCRIKAHSPP